MKIKSFDNWICKTLLTVWNNLQGKINPSLSPLVSFLYHPKFKVAREMGNFERWANAGLRFYHLGTTDGMHSEEILTMKLGSLSSQVKKKCLSKIYQTLMEKVQTEN